MEKQQNNKLIYRAKTQVCSSISNPLVKAAPTFINAAVSLSETLLKIAEDAYQLFWQAYQRAGCPYGESEEGLQQWLDKCVESFKKP